MENGKAAPSTKPVYIRQSCEEFRKIDSDNFRAQFKKLKQITGLHLREGKREREHGINIHFHWAVILTRFPTITTARKEKKMLDQLRDNGEKIPGGCMKPAAAIFSCWQMQAQRTRR